MNESKAQLEALQKRATAALNTQAFGELQQLCKKILSIDKNQADAWFFMSIVAEAGRQPQHAIQFIDRALTISSRHPEYLSQKAKLHSLLNQFAEAKAAVDQAIAIKPDQAIVLDTLGVVMTRLGHYQQAADLLKQAVRKQPDNAQFQFNLGSAEQFLGRDDAARSAYEKAIASKPGFARAWWALSELEKNQPDAGRLDTLLQVFQGASESSEDSLYLCHAIAREYEKQQDFDRAFSYLECGKRKHRSRIRYSSASDTALFEAIHTAFGKSPPRPAASDALDGRAVFVVGMPRTGTTLVERILSSHSQVASLGELQDFPRALKKLTGTPSSLVLDPATVSAAATVEMSNVGTTYARLLTDRVPASGRFIDKLPLNFFCVGYILAALPDARIVCLRRNALDTCLSNYRQLFALNFSYYNYHYDLADTARFYVEYDRLMNLWQTLFGNRVHQLHYETLIAEPEQTVRSLLDYLELDWQSECLEFHRNKNAVATASATQVRQPLYSSAVARWKHYEKHLTPAMEVLDAAGVTYR